MDADPRLIQAELGYDGLYLNGDQITGFTTVLPGSSSSLFTFRRGDFEPSTSSLEIPHVRCPLGRRIASTARALATPRHSWPARISFLAPSKVIFDIRNVTDIPSPMLIPLETLKFLASRTRSTSYPLRSWFPRTFVERASERVRHSQLV